MEKKHNTGRIQITTDCNHNCIFCSVQKKPIQSLSFKEVKETLDTFKQKGVTDVSFTGGEPLVHPDFVKILKYANKLDFPEFTVQTNGSLINTQIINLMKECVNLKCFISFHTSNKDLSKKLCGEDTLSEVISNIKLLGKNNISLSLALVINELNYGELIETGKFIINEFPFVRHISLNFIDPPEGISKDRSIVPALYKIESYLYSFLDFLNRNAISFRVERIPLCYIKGFEEYSTGTRMIVKKEKRMTYFSQTNAVEKLNTYIHQDHVKDECCLFCSLNKICPGINQRYSNIYGKEEIHAVFNSPLKIMEKINPTILEAKKELNLFKHAIETKPNKNNIYDTYTYFLMKGIGFREESAIISEWNKYLRAIPYKEELLSLYVHIPFCRSSCDYCIYPSLKNVEPKVHEKYINFLIDKIILFSEIFNNRRFRHLYIGGGTPSIISKELMEKLLKTIHKKFLFHEKAEKTVECNPDSTTKEKIELFHKYGFNKISIGVQTLSTEILDNIGRGYQDKNKIKQTIDWAFESNIEYICADLMLGLKGDNIKNIISSIEQLADMNPHAISIYPIKADDNYIKKRLKTQDSFNKFYIPLFKEFTRILPNLSEKKGYNYENKVVSLVHPFHLVKKGTSRKVIDNYSNFRSEPYSILGLGYYSESCIDNKIRYIFVDKKHTETLYLKNFETHPEEYNYSVIKINKIYEKVKYIVTEIMHDFKLDLKKYKERFSSTALEDFRDAIYSLELLGIITLTKDQIKFNVDSEEELYAPLLFFVGKKLVLSNI